MNLKYKMKVRKVKADTVLNKSKDVNGMFWITESKNIKYKIST